MNAAVLVIGKMHFEGNIIPMPWFSRLTFENGKPNTVAIICLSEIIYWYRPKVVRDEDTGNIIEYRQKFKSDKWQCHYGAMADRFGLTKDQVRNALHFLRDKGLITLDFRNIITTAGQPLSNVLFVEPVPDEIAKITYPEDEAGGVSHRKDTLSPQERHPLPIETDTYTETPKETPKEERAPLSKTDNGIYLATPKDATLDPLYLPEVQPQIDMLIPKAAREDEQHTMTLQAIERSTWRIAGEARDAAVEFIIATGLPMPMFGDERKDWKNTLAQHAAVYGTTRLKSLYPAAVRRLRDAKFTIARPGSLTKTITAIAAEEAQQPEKKKHPGFEWIESVKF